MATNDITYNSVMKALEDYDFKESTRFFDLISLKNEEIDRLKEQVRTLKNEREELELLEEMDLDSDVSEHDEPYSPLLAELDSDITGQPHVYLPLSDYVELVADNRALRREEEPCCPELEAKISQLETENLALKLALKAENLELVKDQKRLEWCASNQAEFFRDEPYWIIRWIGEEADWFAEADEAMSKDWRDAIDAAMGGGVMSDCKAVNGIGNSFVDEDGLWDFCHCETCTLIADLKAQNAELLEALISAERVLEWGEPKPKPVLREVQQAIAKAKGE